MDDVGQIHGAQQLLHASDAEIGLLLEDQHLRMVVDGEGLLRELVVCLPSEYARDIDRRKGFKHRHQLVAQLPFEHPGLCHVVAPDDVLVRRATDQISIVCGRQRIAFRHPCHGGPLAVGRHEDVVALAERLHEPLQLLGVVVPVDLQIEVALIQSAVGVVAFGAQRQAVIPVRFVDRRGADQRDVRRPSRDG